MIKRRTLGLAVATTLLTGLGTYGATAAFSATPSPEVKPVHSVPVSPVGTPQTKGTDAKDTDALIQRCTQNLPAAERGKVQKEMRDMMGGDHGASGHSMSDHRSGGSMMGDSAGSMMDDSTGSHGDATS